MPRHRFLGLAVGVVAPASAFARDPASLSLHDGQTLNLSRT